MTAFVRLVKTHLRGFLRDRSAWFWSFAFPVFFVLMFGFMFGGGQRSLPKLPIGVVNEDRSIGSVKLIEGLKKVPIFDLKAGSADAEKDSLRKGDRRAVIVIPRSFSRSFVTGESSNLVVWYDDSQPQVWQTIRSSLEQSIVYINQSRFQYATSQLIARTNKDPADFVVVTSDRIPLFRNTSLSSEKLRVVGKGKRLRMIGRKGGWFKILLADGTTAWLQSQFALREKPAAVATVSDPVTTSLVQLKPEPIQRHTRERRFIDFLIPGIIAMSIMQLGLFSAIPIVRERELGILRRIGATPLPRSTYVMSQVAFRVTVGFMQTGLLIGVGMALFKVRFEGSFLGLCAFIILGSLTFMMIGGVIGSLARTTEGAIPLVQMVNFPFMFLGGIFFPIDMMPKAFQPVVQLIPTLYLSQAIRSLAYGQAEVRALLTDAAILVVWLIGGLLVASKVFRWD